MHGSRAAPEAHCLNQHSYGITDGTTHADAGDAYDNTPSAGTRAKTH